MRRSPWLVGRDIAGTTEPQHRDDALIATWSARIDELLGSLLPHGRRVALVNFPNHRNAGDPALWLGARAALDRIGAEVVYRASWASYDPVSLRRALGDGTILLQAGGNFGDLYPGRQQATRERILSELADVPTVQLPQSVHFEDPTNLERMRRLCDRHADLTLMVRDRASLDLVEAHFDVPTQLCPDLSMALGPLATPRRPSVDVVWLARNDPERRDEQPPVPSDSASIRIVDWLDDLDHEPAAPLLDRVAAGVNRRLLARYEAGSPLSRRTGRLDAATYDRLARRWVVRGLHVLSEGRVVVTDRLHGHLLALLMGTPHVVLDNSIGKVGAYIATWTHSTTLTHPADDSERALLQAKALLVS